MGILDIFKNTRSSIKPDVNSFKVKAERYSNFEFKPVVGDPLTLWHKSDSDLINIYAMGSSGMMVLFGWIKDEEIANHLRKNGFYDATLISYSPIVLHMNLILKNKFWSLEDAMRRREDYLKSSLLKPYDLQKEWTLRFKMIDEYSDSTKINCRCKDYSEVINNWDELANSIWLENNEGKVVSLYNYSLDTEIVKTLRALYLGKSIQIARIRIYRGFYDFILEV